MKIIWMALIAAIGGYVLCASHPALAKAAAELYQEGLMKENAEGDLEAAIKVYQKIVKKHPDEASVAAYEGRYGLYRQLYPALTALYGQM